VIELIASDDTRAVMSRASRARHGERFDLVRMVREVAILYRLVLAKRTRRSAGRAGRRS
jgi:hypothetical protein